MSATLAGLQADLLRHARSKTPGAGLRGPTGPGVPGPNVLDRYPRVRPGPDRAGLGTLLGWLYVVEGMRLHLHVLESMERRASGLPPDSAGNASVLARWNMVVAAVEKAPLAGSDLADLLAGAHDALRCLSTDLDSDGA
ncbi:hypothetical protein [Xanthobacter versatilis]|uniref:hypothetical protein n=1 Tax=Xanthobacter autotrophicus (strain ATCC BAA-1158 / Py2) TaxID=78245 RepID=UPI00372B30EF